MAHSQARPNPKTARSRERAAREKATIVDVAEAAGVSYATVSRVVNNKSNVAPETRDRVLAMMQELGYQANLHARRLVGGRSNVIGVLVHGLASQYLSEIFGGIQDVLSATDFDLMLYTTHRRTSDALRSVDMLSGGLAEGLLIVLPHHPERYVSTLRERSYPYILIDHKGASKDDVSVVAANWQGGFDAVHYLIQLGHRRIAIITGNMEMDSASDRLEGYRAALQRSGIPIDPSLIYQGDYHETAGMEGLLALLSLPNPPTAIFASNDIMALGALEAARTRNIAVPGQVSIVGFDDIPMASMSYPRLTTVRQPLAEMGRVATRMLLRRLNWAGQNGESATPVVSNLVMQSVVLPTELILRGSAAPPGTGQSIEIAR